MVMSGSSSPSISVCLSIFSFLSVSHFSFFICISLSFSFFLSVSFTFSFSASLSFSFFPSFFILHSLTFFVSFSLSCSHYVSLPPSCLSKSLSLSLFLFCLSHPLCPSLSLYYSFHVSLHRSFSLSVTFLLFILIFSYCCIPEQRNTSAGNRCLPSSSYMSSVIDR